MSESYEPYLQEVLIDADTLQRRIRELGQQISAEYADKNSILLVCVLKGGVMFLTDLMRQIAVPHSIDFMALSSYGDGVRESFGRVRIDMDLRQDIGGKHIIVVEDIIDSGRTLNSVVELLSTRNPKSLQVCTLLDKAERREVDVPIRYRGFTIPNKFVFGYGLDMDEYYRNLPFIGVPDLSRYQAPE